MQQALIPEPSLSAPSAYQGLRATLGAQPVAAYQSNSAAACHGQPAGDRLSALHCPNHHPKPGPCMRKCIAMYRLQSLTHAALDAVVLSCLLT